MLVARANGRLKGRQSKLTAGEQAQVLQLHSTGEHTISELAKRLAVGRATIYRVLARAGTQAA